MAGTNEVEIIVKAATSHAVADVKRFTKSVTSEVTRMVNASTSRLRRFDKMTRQIGKGIQSIGKRLVSLKSIAIGALVGWGLRRLISHWEELSGVQERAEAGMIQAMKSMGRHTPELEKKLFGVAKGLQAVTTFGDEATLEGMKFLLTYKDITDDLLPRTAAVMLDLAALMGGDTRQAANMLGKASMGLTGELRRVGITVEQDTYKARGFLGVLEEIEQQVKGQAEALAKTDYGKLKQFGNVVSDVEEKFGKFATSVKVKIAEVLLPKVKELNDKIEQLAKSGKLEEWAAKTAGAIIRAFQAAVKGVRILYNIVKGVQGTVAETAASVARLRTKTLTQKARVLAIGRKSGQVAYGKVGGGVWYTTRERAAEIEGARESYQRWNQVAENTARTQAKVNRSFAEFENLVDGIRTKVEGTAKSVDKATKSTGQFFNYLAAQKGENPFVLEPQIKKSPPQPWASGIAEMQADLARIGGTIKATFDMAGIANIFANLSALPRKIQELGFTQDPGALVTPGFRSRAAAEIKRYTEMYDLQMRLLRGLIGDIGAVSTPTHGLLAGLGRRGSVVINLGGVTVYGAESEQMANKLDTAIAQKIKYGRSQILAELRAAGL
ncbi:MAG: hypothetical protein JRJ66_01435 [Deltaproteobacteria bacterium]|nr:hypothetical protein [Deltaproteobacteria bacterium]MBW2081692.1 hypothetical protein [Deltaproteobacteria bacterium]MBW2298887.1 hypothetical protein [Deltaproteobacteria bacterium]